MDLVPLCLGFGDDNPLVKSRKLLLSVDQFYATSYTLYILLHVQCSEEGSKEDSGQTN
jgi:hypothetical protein